MTDIKKPPEAVSSGGDAVPTARGKLPPTGGGECRCSPAGTKGDRTPSMVSCPLLTPLTFLCADTSKMCSETGVTGARFRASGRFRDAFRP